MMMRSQSRREIWKALLALRRDLNNIADHLIETRQLFLEYLELTYPESSRMSSSSADTGQRLGVIIHTLDDTPKIPDDSSGVIPAAASSPSRETRSERDDSL